MSLPITRRGAIGSAVLFCGAAFGLSACASTAGATTAVAGAATASSTPSSSATVSSSTSSTSTKLGAGKVTVTVDGAARTYKAAYVVNGIHATVDGGTYAAAASDEVVFLVVNGGRLTVTGATITKGGNAGASSSQRSQDVADAYNFYGLNSAVVVVGKGSRVTIANSTITTTSSGSNAVMAVDSGGATVTSTSISTSGNSSRGFHASFGGSVRGSGLTIRTKGAHSAAVATDRGGGTVRVTGKNTFQTAGDGSPLVYSTGAISVSGVTGTATGAEAIVVEGKNSVAVTGSTLTSAGSHAVMIYQSMSGDAADANAQTSSGVITMLRSTLRHTGSGSAFYFTNTTAKLAVTGSSVAGGSKLASAAEDRWGTSGSNGATVTIVVDASKLTGSVVAGSDSSIRVTTRNSGSVTGKRSGSVTVTAA